MRQWQAHATFDPAGEMTFGVQADDITSAADLADTRLAAFGLPVAEVRIAELPGPLDR